MNAGETQGHSSSPGPDKWFSSESEFHLLYPASLYTLAKNHWTPLLVAKKAADFLAVTPGCRVLDIGSGIGKFCLAAAYYKPDSFFYGIEQREDLVHYAENARKALGLQNASFVHGNILNADFSAYDHFYFYNAFYENLVAAEKIDEKISYSIALYNRYTRFLYDQLDKKPPGTRIVTFHGLDDILPPGYLEGGNEIDNLLRYWVKL